MTDRLEPGSVLTTAQWERIRELKADGHLDRALLAMGTQELGLAGLIAAANEALPDTDHRKITREKLRYVRQLMGVHEDEEREFLDALASYLPPEHPVTENPDPDVPTLRLVRDDKAPRRSK